MAGGVLLGPTATAWVSGLLPFGIAPWSEKNPCDALSSADGVGVLSNSTVSRSEACCLANLDCWALIWASIFWRR